MRDLVLDRVYWIKARENGFDRSFPKWNRPLSHGSTVNYADEIIFEDLSDIDLFFLYERIIRRYYS